eukprot:68753_1
MGLLNQENTFMLYNEVHKSINTELQESARNFSNIQKLDKINKNNCTSLKMHQITNNGFTSQKYVVKEHIDEMDKFITWFYQSTTSLLLDTSLYYIFEISNVILSGSIHLWTMVVEG